VRSAKGGMAMLSLQTEGQARGSYSLITLQRENVWQAKTILTNELMKVPAAKIMLSVLKQIGLSN